VARRSPISDWRTPLGNAAARSRVPSPRTAPAASSVTRSKTRRISTSRAPIVSISAPLRRDGLIARTVPRLGVQAGVGRARPEHICDADMRVPATRAAVGSEAVEAASSPEAGDTRSASSCSSRGGRTVQPTSRPCRLSAPTMLGSANEPNAVPRPGSKPSMALISASTACPRSSSSSPPREAARQTADEVQNRSTSASRPSRSRVPLTPPSGSTPTQVLLARLSSRRADGAGAG
jgi:hypothetical protein